MLLHIPYTLKMYVRLKQRIVTGIVLKTVSRQFTNRCSGNQLSQLNDPLAGINLNLFPLFYGALIVDIFQRIAPCENILPDPSHTLRYGYPPEVFAAPESTLGNAANI